MIVVILIELDNELEVLIITIEIKAQKYGLFLCFQVSLLLGQKCSI